MRLLTAALSGALMLVAHGCERTAGEPSGDVLLLDSPPLRTPLEERLSIGKGIEEGPGVEFGRITDLDIDAEGRIWVADRPLSQVHVFAPSGRHLGSLGQEGEGPGEFMFLSGLAYAPDGSVLAMDPSGWRLTRFGPSLQLLGTIRVQMARQVTIPWTGVIDREGSLYRPRGAADDGEWMLLRSQLEPDSLSAPDTLRVAGPRVAYYSQTRGSVTMRSPVPFSPGRHWAVGRAGTVWVSTEADYRLHEVSFAGDTVRTVAVSAEPVRLTRREVDSLRAATGLRRSDLPRAKPVIRRISSDRSGKVWVMAEVGPGPGSLVLDRIDPDLGSLMRFELPVRWDPEKAAAAFCPGFMALATTDSLGVMRVKVFDLPMGERATESVCGWME